MRARGGELGRGRSLASLAEEGEGPLDRVELQGSGAGWVAGGELEPPSSSIKLVGRVWRRKQAGGRAGLRRGRQAWDGGSSRGSWLGSLLPLGAKACELLSAQSWGEGRPLPGRFPLLEGAVAKGERARRESRRGGTGSARSIAPFCCPWRPSVRLDADRPRARPATRPACMRGRPGALAEGGRCSDGSGENLSNGSRAAGRSASRATSSKLGRASAAASSPARSSIVGRPVSRRPDARGRDIEGLASPLCSLIRGMLASLLRAGRLGEGEV